MKAPLFSDYNWDTLIYNAEEKQSCSAVKSEIEKIKSSVLSSIKAIRKCADSFHLDLMEAARQIGEQKGFLFRTQPLYKNASNSEKKWMVKLIKKVANTESTLEKSDVADLSILFGMEAIHHLYLSPPSQTQAPLTPEEKLIQMYKTVSAINDHIKSL